jgi:hypothetical protein
VKEKGRETKNKGKHRKKERERGRNGLANGAADSEDDSVALGHRVGVSLLGPNAVGDVGDSFLEPIWPKAVWAPMAHGQRDRERESERCRQMRMPLCLFQAVYANFRNNLFLWENSLLFSPNGTARFIAGALCVCVVRGRFAVAPPVATHVIPFPPKKGEGKGKKPPLPLPLPSL